MRVIADQLLILSWNWRYARQEVINEENKMYEWTNC